jgi:putative transposase
MKVNRFSLEKIVKILKESEAFFKVEDICQYYGISKQTFYDWQNKYGSMELIDIIQLKNLEEENRQLKLVVDDLRLHNQMLRNCLEEVPMLSEQETTVDYETCSFEMNNQKKVYH